jgi:hypothetical protein
MVNNLFEDTEYALAEAVAATLLAGWLLTCQRKSVMSQIQIIELAAKWIDNDGPAAQTLQNEAFGRWICPHLDHIINATAPPRQNAQIVPDLQNRGTWPMQPCTE